MLGPTGAGNPHVEGLYVDDGWSVSGGPSEEDSHAVEDCGLSPDDVKALVAGYQEVEYAFESGLRKMGKYGFQLLDCSPDTTGICGGAPQTAPNRNQTDPRTDCAAWLRSACSPESELPKLAMLFGFTRITHHQPFPLPAFEQDLATFLLSRGDYAWLGYGWLGCHSEPPGYAINATAASWVRPPAMDVDYGRALGTCQETAPNSGVFTREYEHASVKMDCDAWQASITMK